MVVVATNNVMFYQYRMSFFNQQHFIFVQKKISNDWRLHFYVQCLSLLIKTIIFNHEYLFSKTILKCSVQILK